MSEDVRTLFGIGRTRRFVRVDDDDPRGSDDAVHGADGREYRVVERHRFVEDHMLGEVVLGQTCSTVLFVEDAP